MPGLSDKVCVVEAAKEVFENVTDYEKVISNKVNQNKKSSNKDSFFQNSPLMDQMKRLPCYQEVLLLIELHLMGDTGPLPMYLRNNIADMANSEVHVSEMENHHECKNKVENAKNDEKLVALRKVNRIMNNKPWAINKYHIQELRGVALSISEIIQSLLIMAHFHTLSAIESISRRIAESETKRKQPMSKRNSLINGRIEMVKYDEKNNIQEPQLNDRLGYLEGRNLLDERLCGITCQRFWDDFGFSVLNCLNEQSSLLLDNRFACLQKLRKRNEKSARKLQAFWKYSQQLLGFEFVANENAVNDEDLNEREKELVYKVCFRDEQTKNYPNNEKDSLSILTLVTVQEAKMKAEIIYALHAVTQFMNW